MQLIDEKIWKYICDHSSKEKKILSQLRRETEIKCLNPIMLSSVFQGNLLSVISKIKNPRKILEIGTYTGYSTLCLADGLSDDGQIHTIDKNEELLYIQNKYFDKSIHKKKIIQHTGNALNIIPNLILYSLMQTKKIILNI